MPQSPVVGVLRVTLHIPASNSLKAKRQVTAGLLRRLRTRFKVAAAEVDHGDRWQLTELAIAYVSGDRRHVDEVLQHTLTYIEGNAEEAMITDVSTELVSL